MMDIRSWRRAWTRWAGFYASLLILPGLAGWFLLFRYYDGPLWVLALATLGIFCVGYGLGAYVVGQRIGRDIERDLANYRGRSRRR